MKSCGKKKDSKCYLVKGDTLLQERDLEMLYRRQNFVKNKVESRERDKSTSRQDSPQKPATGWEGLRRGQESATQSGSFTQLATCLAITWYHSGYTRTQRMEMIAT